MSAQGPAIVGVLIFLLFLFPSSVFARSMSFTVDKDSLFGDEELHVTAIHSGFIDGETIYIKGAFYQESSTNYFGYTKKEDSWIKNGDDTVKQRQIVVGQWDNNLILKSDFSDSGFKGEGEYKLKIGYYYNISPGKLSSVNWASSSATILLNEPDPTPTNTPVPTVANTPTSTPASTHTPIPTVTPTNTITPTVSPTSTPSGMVIEEDIESSDGGIILGKQTVNDDSSVIQSGLSLQKRPYVTVLLGVGVVLALIAALYVIKITIYSK